MDVPVRIEKMTLGADPSIIRRFSGDLPTGEGTLGLSCDVMRCLRLTPHALEETPPWVFLLTAAFPARDATLKDPNATSTLPLHHVQGLERRANAGQ